jgi:hypothetical protein
MFVPHRKHRPQRRVTGIALLFSLVDDVRTPQETQASKACYGESFTFLLIDDIRNSQETQTFTACYGGGESFTYLLVDDYRTSQETQASTARYGESFTLLDTLLSSTGMLFWSKVVPR